MKALDRLVGAELGSDTMAAPFAYSPDFLRPDFSRLLLAEFAALDWQQRDTPRQEYFCSDVGLPYTYGRGAGQRTYEPQPWTSSIRSVQLAAEIEAEELLVQPHVRFEVVFLNRYLNERNSLGWHADDSPEMDDARPIAVVSIGAEREIWFRPKDPERHGEPVQKLKLGDGSLLLMPPGFQDEWEHRIPKASFKCGERVSMTFRGYAPPVVP